MALNLWRYVRYSDDGCAIYECLNCYRGWEGRDEPGYYHWETNQYIACWHFCPFCGTKWDGPLHASEEEKEHRYGPRRARIWAAQRKRWDEEALRRNHRPDQPPFIWVIEVQAQWRDSPEAKWESRWRFTGFKTSVRSVLNSLNTERAECHARNQPGRVGPDPDDLAEPPLTWRARLVAVKGLRATGVSPVQQRKVVIE
jgi:hypothetical protein